MVHAHTVLYWGILVLKLMHSMYVKFYVFEYAYSIEGLDNTHSKCPWISSSPKSAVGPISNTVVANTTMYSCICTYKAQRVRHRTWGTHITILSIYTYAYWTTGRPLLSTQY